MSRLWILLAGPDGSVQRLARGTVEFGILRFAAGAPVRVVSPVDGQEAELHEGGYLTGWPLPVPAIAPALRADWLARSIGAAIYRTPCGFQRALDERRGRHRALRAAAQAWRAFDVPPHRRMPHAMGAPGR